MLLSSRAFARSACASRAALRAHRHAVAPLQVRAFRDSHKEAKDKEAHKRQAQHEAEQTKPMTTAANAGAEVEKRAPAAPAPAPQAGPAGAGDLAAPLRVRSLFDELQREMDAMTRAFFGDGDPWGMLAPRHRHRHRRAASPFDMLGAFEPMMMMAPPAPPALSAAAPAAMQAAMARLATDVHEDDKAYVIKADVPGM